MIFRLHVSLIVYPPEILFARIFNLILLTIMISVLLRQLSGRKVVLASASPRRIQILENIVRAVTQLFKDVHGDVRRDFLAPWNHQNSPRRSTKLLLTRPQNMRSPMQRGKH